MADVDCKRILPQWQDRFPIFSCFSAWIEECPSGTDCGPPRNGRALEGDLDSRLTLLLLPKQDVFLRSGKDAAAVSRVQEELWPEVFRTRQLASPLFCHETFLEKLSGYRTQPIGKRVGLLLQRLAVDESRLHFKATQGVNRGWRRSRLGGNFGSHFYAWWAPGTRRP